MAIYCKNCHRQDLSHSAELACPPPADTLWAPCLECGLTPVPHTPSPYCRSGQRPHCTCDTCF